MTTQNQNWTAEPWQVTHLRDGSDLINQFRIGSGEFGEIARTPELPYEMATANEANVDRIVACINACSGMADPAAEIASMREMVEQARAILKTRIIEPLGYGSNVLRP